MKTFSEFRTILIESVHVKNSNWICRLYHCGITLEFLLSHTATHRHKLCNNNSLRGNWFCTHAPCTNQSSGLWETVSFGCDGTCWHPWRWASEAGHLINDVILIPLELLRSNRDAVRKAREAHLIHKENTLSPLGINRLDEAYWYMIPPSLQYQ